ncbi:MULTISPECIES: hypothetical protein [Paracoccaceae]|uniref:hypothetical protein n=1 Tax=Paracoccaceae TaxID=31989 RepID=UPI001571B0FD|nr:MULTISPECIES: hypothetical protein [Paracoccaceae]MBJ2153098.1 hypothetical protein [Paracoccus sp. IB05]NTT88203.1 hypothetical protein [Tabrizicola sp. SY72]
MDRVVLYSEEATASTRKWWRTDAGLDGNGDIRIISGDGKIEWHMTIAAKDVPLMRSALSCQLQDAADRDALTLLAQRFTVSAGGGNPYDEIQVFLERENISHNITTW